MSYQYWRQKEYKIEKAFKKAGYKKAERIPLSRDVLGGTSEDIIVPELNMLVDVKSTRGEKSIRIKRESLEKIKKDAKSKEMRGGIIFTFRGGKKKYLILELNDFFKYVKN